MIHKTRHFSELRAEGVESNLFQYHLRHLINKKLVQKCELGYELAPNGLYYADRFSPEFKGERPQPKLITVAVVHNGAGQVLLLKKARQPWLGDYHFPAGKIHTGETTDQAAMRELSEKAGITVDDVYFRALTHTTITKGGGLVSDNYGFIFRATYEGEVPGGEWKDIDDPAVKALLAPGVEQIYEFEQLGSGKFYPLTIDL